MQSRHCHEVMSRSCYNYNKLNCSRRWYCASTCISTSLYLYIYLQGKELQVSILQDRQLVAQADVVIISCITEGITIDKHEMDVAPCLPNAAQYLRPNAKNVDLLS
jgi:hypothetical protein